MNSRHTAPTGIKAIAALTMIGGFLGLFQAFLTFVGAAALGAPVVGVVLASVLAVVEVSRIAVAYGLLTLQSWGWSWGLVVFGVLALLQLATVVLAGDALAVIQLAINLGIIAYVYLQKDLYRQDDDRHVPEPNSF